MTLVVVPMEWIVTFLTEMGNLPFNDDNVLVGYLPADHLHEWQRFRVEQKGKWCRTGRRILIPKNLYRKI